MQVIRDKRQAMCGYEMSQRILEAVIEYGYSEEEYENECARMVGASALFRETPILESRTSRPEEGDCKG